MSEPVPLPPDDLCDSPSVIAGAPPSVTHAPPIAGESATTTLDAPVDLQAMLEMIGQGLTTSANETTRTAARELWSRLSQLITAVPALSSAAIPAAPALPAPAAAPAAPGLALTQLPVIPAPTTPIASVTRILRQLPPEQLLDVVLHRLRAALPAGTTVPTPKAIQFQLVPVPPSATR